MGRLQSFWWASKSGSGLPGSISQTTSLAQGREVDAPVPGRERQNWHRVNKVGLVVPFAVSRPGARDIHRLEGKNMTYLTPHTTACFSAPATTALSASQCSAIGKAEGIATLLPWQDNALGSLLLCCAYTQPYPPQNRPATSRGGKKHKSQEVKLCHKTRSSRGADTVNGKGGCILFEGERSFLPLCCTGM